jgi:hypothetical protein
VRGVSIDDGCLSEAGADREVESQILGRLHLFPNLEAVALQAPPSRAAWEGPPVQWTLQGVARSICWPRMKRVALGWVLQVQPQGNVLPEESDPPLPSRAADSATAAAPPDDGGEDGDAGLRRGILEPLRCAVGLEELLATRLCAPRARDFFAGAGLVEALAALPRLRTLHLGLVSYAAEDEPPVVSEPAVRALARAPSLRALRLENFGVDDGLLSSFCRELREGGCTSSSTQLADVEFDDLLPRITRAGLLSLWELLQTNHRLVRFEVHCWDEYVGEEAAGSGDGPALSALEQEVQVLCELNRAGRGAALADPQRAARRDWLRLLGCAASNVGAAFGLLQRCPGLCGTSVADSRAASQPPSVASARRSNQLRAAKQDGADRDSKPAAVRPKRRRLK